jgi:hypothetical protein
LPPLYRHARGYVTFEALRWIHDSGAAFIHIDKDHRVITASTPSRLDDSRLRRAQAAAALTDAGLMITRYLIDAKVRGQERVLDTLSQALAKAFRFY